jgi:hypothetical protein
MSKKCDYPGCQELATIRCCSIGCNHEVCETHGNGAMEVSPEEDAPICWECDGKGWPTKENRPINFIMTQ